MLGDILGRSYFYLNDYGKVGYGVSDKVNIIYKNSRMVNEFEKSKKKKDTLLIKKL